MPTIIEAGYEKKLDLPRRFCNQSFFLSVRLEINDDADVAKEGARLHRMLQGVVDRQLKKVGYLPGVEAEKPSRRRRPETFEVIVDRLQKGKAKCATLINGIKEWACDEAQRDMILALVKRHCLDKPFVEELAKSLHGVGVRALTRDQATTFIEELVRQHPQANNEENEP